MNVHTPERQPNESREQYKQRRLVSKSLNIEMRYGPKQEPARMEVQPDGTAKIVNGGGWMSFWTGQHHNTAKNKKRAVKRLIGNRQLRKSLRDSAALQ